MLSKHHKMKSFMMRGKKSKMDLVTPQAPVVMAPSPVTQSPVRRNKVAYGELMDEIKVQDFQSMLDIVSIILYHEGLGVYWINCLSNLPDRAISTIWQQCVSYIANWLASYVVYWW